MDSENVENGNKMRRRSRSDVGHGVQADEGNLSKSISSYRSRRTVLKDVTNIAEDSSVAEQGNSDRPSLLNVVANTCIDELMVDSFGGNSVVPQCNRVKRCKSVVQNAKRDLGSEFNKVAVFETMKNEEDNFEGSGVDQRSECIVECGEGSSNPRKRRRSLKYERDGVGLQLQNVDKLGGGPCSNRRKRRRRRQKMNRNSTFEYDDLNDAINGKALLQINSDDYATDNTNFLSLTSENASNSAVKLDTACSSVTPDNSKKKKGKGISEEDIEEILGIGDFQTPQLSSTKGNLRIKSEP
ncbi:hypothetical protein RIF29_04847 [Crotalaria pallida]|uniref:Uncharacterized protein n=1 Tax=Crotalaria pallida TaxID=3830 RepID=A0AAN9J1E5_CROPI